MAITDLPMIVVPPDEAEAKLAEYTAAVREERTAEDDRLAVAYRAAKRGLPLISLSSCITAAGFFPNGMPRLAVVRADARTVFCRWTDYGAALLYSDVDDWRVNRGAAVNDRSVRVVPRKFPERRNAYWEAATTVVPSIPPRHRPRRWRLHAHHLLWEVESWTRVPPTDPALIRHIRGDLWAVVAVWDLTELERAVLL